MRTAPDKGRVTDYIPERASVDPDQFGIVLTLAEGCCSTVGGGDTPFFLQSVSKIFALALALGRLGDGLWHRVGQEPFGLPFYSILQLEHEGGIPRNPFINAGELVVSDAILAGHQPWKVLREVLRFWHAPGPIMATATCRWRSSSPGMAISSTAWSGLAGTATGRAISPIAWVFPVRAVSAAVLRSSRWAGSRLRSGHRG